MELTYLPYLVLSFLLGSTLGALILLPILYREDFDSLKDNAADVSNRIRQLSDTLISLRAKVELAETIVLIPKTAPVLDDQCQN